MVFEIFSYLFAGTTSSFHHLCLGPSIFFTSLMSFLLQRQSLRLMANAPPSDLTAPHCKHARDNGIQNEQEDTQGDRPFEIVLDKTHLRKLP